MPRVLCIEDEELIREEIIEELNDAGYETLEAANGAQGLKVICEQMPDLIICDMTMPFMSGDQVLETLRNDHPDLKRIPFLFVTALADQSSMDHGLELGADAYITKPIDFDHLLEEVEARLT